jgi:hypothetical protein
LTNDDLKNASPATVLKEERIGDQWQVTGDEPAYLVTGD